MWHQYGDRHYHHYYCIAIIHLSWILTSFIINQYYSSYFYTSLTVHEYNDPIDTIDDLLHLLQDNESQVITGDSFVFNQKLLNARPEHGIFYQLGVKLNQSRSRGKIGRYEQNLMELIITEKKSICVELLFFLQLLKIRSNLSDLNLVHIGSENLFQVFHVYVIEKPNSPLLRPFNMG